MKPSAPSSFPANAARSAEGLRIALAVSRYHSEITQSMCAAAEQAFLRAGGSADNLTIVHVPGTWELTAACRALAMLASEAPESAPDALLAIGCVITGETTHDQYICQAVTQGLTSIICNIGVPIAFGVLTCRNMEQARARSIEASRAGGVNKGEEAMLAAIESVHVLRSIHAGHEVR